jgi:hypothetical protein
VTTGNMMLLHNPALQPGSLQIPKHNASPQQSPLCQRKPFYRTAIHRVSKHDVADSWVEMWFL